MITLNFEEQNKSIAVNYKLLETISQNISNEKESAALTEALFQTGIPSIVMNLISDDLLCTEQCDAVWNGGNTELRQCLLENMSFIKNMTDVQASDILKLNDITMLSNIAYYAEFLYPKKDGQQAKRLSGKMADALMTRILQCNHSSVQRSLAENLNLPKKFRFSVRELLKKGVSFKDIQLQWLTFEDIPLLEMSIENLKRIASFIEDVKDIATRDEIIKIILKHEEPSVRIELAENNFAPRYALELLLGDSEPDVVAAAQKSLEGNNDDREAIDFDDIEAD